MGNPGDSTVGQWFKPQGQRAIDSTLQTLAQSGGPKFTSDPLTGSTENALAQAEFQNRGLQEVGAGLLGQQENQRQQGIAQTEADKKEKARLGYIENYNKGLADQESMKALEDAKAATRRKTGRQINFFG